MKHLNKLMSLLLVGISLGTVSGADVIKTTDGAAAGVATHEVVADVSRPSKALITLKEVNRLRTDPNVKVLFALPKLPESARASIPLAEGFSGRVRNAFQINGQDYDLWTAGRFSDLELDCGSASYTFNTSWSDRTTETWYSNYYLVKQGDAPGESRNALDMTGQIAGISGTVYVFLGEIFLNQKDSSSYDNYSRQEKQEEVNTAMKRALAARTQAAK